jgi:hypothetical protein
MEALRGLAAVALLLPALALGALWTRRAWRTRDAHTCLALGAVVGLSTHVVTLNALSYLFLPGFATILLVLAEAVAAVWLGYRAGREEQLQTEARGARLFSFEVCRADVCAVWPWLTPVALLWMWQLAQTGSSDQLAQALFCEPLARRGLPAFHPLDTAQIFNYHYGLPLVAAGLGTVTGLKSWWALNAVLVLLVPVLLGACVEFLRAAAAREGRAATRPELLLGALLFALGGNLSWVDALTGRAGWFESLRPDFACDGPGGLHSAPAFLGGWTWLLAILALLLRWPVGPVGEVDSARSSSVHKAASVPLFAVGLSVGALALIAEHSFLAVGMVLAIVTVYRWGQSWREAWPWMLAGALGLALAVVQGGAITGMTLGLSGSQALSPHWTGHWLPTFPTQAGRVTPADCGAYWTVVWREYAHTLVLLPLLLLWAFSRRGPTAARWLLGAAAPGVLIAFYVSFPLNEFDTYRFYQTYFTAAMLVTGLWLARAWAGDWGPAVPPLLMKADAATLRVPKPLVVVLTAILLLQGVRTTLAGLETHPGLPWDVDPDQERALRVIEAQGRTGEGILCSVPGCLFQVPPSPIVWGRAVPASDPDTDVTVTRSRAWQRAWVCPSPANLRTARARWVLFSGEDLARAAPLLEGLDSFTRVGDFGLYRLYRYDGTWEIPEDGLSDVKLWNVGGSTNLSLGGLRFTSPGKLSSLNDGRIETCVELDTEAFANEGLVIRTGMSHPSMVWLCAAKGTPLLESAFEITIDYLDSSGAWRPVPAPVRTIRSPGRPEALAVRFRVVETWTLLVKLKHRGPQPAPRTVPLAEVWVGQPL